MTDHSKYAVVRTGDILLFYGWGRICTTLRVALASPYSHVGIAVWLKTDNGMNLYCFDVGITRMPDFMTSTYTKRRDCRLLNVDSMLKYYTGFACRHLQHYPPYLTTRLREFMLEHHHRTFRPFTAIVTLNLGLSDNAPSDQVFCSELCSMWLERVGMRLSAEMPHYRISTGMLGNTSMFQNVLGSVHIINDSGDEDRMREMITAVLVLVLFAYISISILRTRK